MVNIAVRRTLAVVITCFAVTAGAGAAEIAVDQRDMQFVPGTAAIAVGDSVRFTDTDRIAHDITVVDPLGAAVDHGMDYFNQQIVVKFDKPGIYQVRCRIHPQMKMTITVK
jgi:plastocyanin